MPPMRALADLAPPPPPRIDRLVPPPRFAHVSFDAYHPQHASQAAALARVRAFVGEAHDALAGRRARLLRRRRASGRGLYLDGGFGVGKTHLLAAAYFHADADATLYLSFQELVYLIGVLGMQRSRAELGGPRMLFIDEFELDDPGNTLIVKSFLSAVADAGGFVLTTSNTAPEAQGQGRFNAEDFRREIQSLAARFETRAMDGPDYRHRVGVGTWTPEETFRDACRHENAPEPRVFTDFDELTAFLERVHPSRYDGLLRQVGTLYLAGGRTLATQNDALRFVHFIDKLYDLGVGLRASGTVPLAELFDSSYAGSAYAKKHLRCLSRLSELLAEDVSGGRESPGRAPETRLTEAPTAER
ncbi:MAG: cell division protein ZapE [Deinococcales bacterium]